MGFIDQIKRSIEDNGTHAFEEQMYVGQIAKALKDGTVPDVPVSISSERRPDLFFGGNRGVELEYVRYGKQIALISIVDAPEADILYPDALISFFESIAADCGYWALPKLGFDFYWTADSQWPPPDKLGTSAYWNFAFDENEPNLLIVRGPIKTGELMKAQFGSVKPVGF